MNGRRKSRLAKRYHTKKAEREGGGRENKTERKRLGVRTEVRERLRMRKEIEWVWIKERMKQRK